MSGRQYLLADIGATHSRFAVGTMTAAEDGAGPGLAATDVVVLPTRSEPRFEALLAAATDRLGLAALRAACIAVAGPVTDGEACMTNGGLSFSEARLAEYLQAPVLLVNDFHALAMGVPGLQRLQQLGETAGQPPGRGVKAVIGPGSGLGMGILIPVGSSGWRVLDSEGGHADLAPGSPLEQEVLTHLQARHGAVCWETVLSGPGLVRLYQVVADIWGAKPQSLGAEEISQRGVDAQDPVCHQTLELFFALLGAAAGNLALTVAARSGVYIAGGIVPQLKDFAAASALRRRFYERADLQDWMAQVPLYLVLDENPGLIGAAACLQWELEAADAR